MGKIDDNDEIADALHNAVDQFNKCFNEWMDVSGCRATFAWKYGADKSIKEIEILAIDRIIYRKPPPTLDRMLQGLSQPTPGGPTPV